MRVSSIRLQNFRSFVDSGVINLGNINVLVGANNTGKSSILRGLYLMQNGGGDFFPDVRVGGDAATVIITYEDVSGRKHWGEHADAGRAQLETTLKTQDRRTGERKVTLTSMGRPEIAGEQVLFPGEEPKHFIVPYLSRRKVTYYDEVIKESTTRQISPTMANLPSRLSRVANNGFPAHRAYADACREILGVLVTAATSVNGHRPGVYVSNDDAVYVEQMGEGVASIAEFLASLAVSEGKLFLVEELENDLHPSALKALLDLVVKSAEKNQFVITTHSNIVVRHLCSQEGSQLFQVKADSKTLPITATIDRVGDSPEARIAVLRDLGYELSDFELWEGWLILEESSAEKIIRRFLIPWFAPKLARVRTLASNGAAKVEPAFEEFRRMFLYAHLEPVYRGRAWVRCDGDETGRRVVDKLRQTYKDVPPDHFGTFDQPQFELYYPREFKPEVERVLGIAEKQDQREEKRKLFLSVEAWLEENEERAKAALAASASEIIADLLKMESALGRTR